MKKRIFNTAVALVAAMSLSTVAFAEAAPGVSDPGVSGPGWSGLEAGGSIYEETVDLTKLGPDDEVLLGGDQGLAILGYRKDFDESVTSVTIKSAIGKLTDEAANAAVKGINGVLEEDEELVREDGKYAIYYGISVTLLDQNGKVIEPKHALTVHVKYSADNEKSTSAAYVSDDGKKAERVTSWNKVKSDVTGEYLYFTFSAKHFSKYYMFRTTEIIKSSDTTNNGSSGSGNSGSGFDNPGSSSGNTTTTQAPEADTAAQYPDSTTVPTGGSDNPGSNEGNNVTNTPADNTPDDGNNNNVGNDGNGNGADKNQATGVVLAVIPAAIAATAVIISKKRK